MPSSGKGSAHVSGKREAGDAGTLRVYAPEDQRLYARFESFLKLLERRLPVELWSVQRILAGSDRARELAAHLAGAHLLVYLFSVDLLDSEYYSREQLQRLVERSRRGDVQIFSVLLRSIQRAPENNLHQAHRSAPA